MDIPKRPIVPSFTNNYVDHISEIVFGKNEILNHSEAVLLFGGSHPGLWETAINQHKIVNFQYIFITGGNKPTAHKHETWIYGDSNEADIIEMKLLEGGIQKDIIIKENRSTNSLENVLFIKDQILRFKIKSILCICKNYGAGRQYRTVKKHIPNISIQMKGFETNIDDHGKMTKNNWIEYDLWKSVVWGEYLRIYFYGKKGDIENDFLPPKEIQEYLDNVVNTKLHKNTR